MASATELYKDKIEVSLDGRQIFYLFFGGAAIVGLVFVLGVMVGRRVEARGHLERAHVEAAIDPLAALDRLEGNGGLSFQAALRGAATPPSEVEKKIGELAKPEAKVEAKVEAKKADVEPKPEPKKVEAEAKSEAKTEAKKAEAEPKTESKKSDAEPKKEKKARFTLQLSSFQDKSEAEAYMQSIKSAGFVSYMTEGEVDGKQFYRVRLGSYRTLDAATDAKADFEKSAKKSALITKL